MHHAVAFVATLPQFQPKSRTLSINPNSVRSRSNIVRSPIRCVLPETNAILCDSSVIETIQHAMFSPLFTPLDACIPVESRLISWLNFRVAVLFFVLSPLSIFIGSLIRGPNTKAGDALTRVMAGYWQASALLLVAVFQHAAGLPLAFFDGLLVQVIVVASINWWSDLLAEINQCDGLLEAAFRIWRPMATVAASIGVLVQLAYQSCNFESSCGCRAWMEPPVRLFELAGGVDKSILTTLGNTGMTIYLGYLLYYIIVAIPKIGREGRAHRDFFTAPSVLMWLGIIGPWGREEKTN